MNELIKTQTSLTVKEFKMWLSGVEEMQDETWIPNPVQWKKIREKINDLAETSQINNRGGTSPEYTRSSEHLPAPTFANPPTLSQSPTANREHFIPPPVLSSNPQQPVKTPTIDTSSGNYTPAFS